MLKRISRQTRRLCAALFAIIAMPASAQQGQIVQYQCNLDGMVAVMTSQVTAVNSAGIVVGSDPTRPITGVIGAGGVSLVYQGQLQSPNALYTFTGRDGFADFTDMTTYERFRVQFQTLPNGQMLMIANPFGPGPTQYLCAPMQ